VLHYTTDEAVQGTLSWFENPESRVSAHYVISRAGTIWQMVDENKKAWHAANWNSRSIGIEFSAGKDQGLSGQQEIVGPNLIKVILAERNLHYSCIMGHRWTGANTDCPGGLWSDEYDLIDWCKKHFS
jgi:N-acetylmuramoyl-L-alanine amidase